MFFVSCRHGHNVTLYIAVFQQFKLKYSNGHLLIDVCLQYHIKLLRLREQKDVLGASLA